MPPLYGLTPRTAADLMRVIAHGDQIGGAGAPRDAARGVTWVKVTGGPDGDGWHPAVLSDDLAGVWGDGTDAVLVAAADAGPLEVGHRYLCTRTGDDDDTHKARFRTLDGRRTVEFHRYQYSCSGGSLIETDTTIRITGYGLTIQEL